MLVLVVSQERHDPFLRFYQPRTIPGGLYENREKSADGFEKRFWRRGTFSVGEPAPAPAKLTKKQNGPVSPGDMAALPSCRASTGARRTVSGYKGQCQPAVRSDGRIERNKVAQLSLAQSAPRKKKRAVGPYCA